MQSGIRKLQGEERVWLRYWGLVPTHPGWNEWNPTDAEGIRCKNGQAKNEQIRQERKAEFLELVKVFDDVKARLRALIKATKGATPLQQP